MGVSICTTSMPTVLRARRPDGSGRGHSRVRIRPIQAWSYEGTMQSQFTAVVTTGIYCREGCGGRPLRRNTRPYAFAAAAEADGFRPCLRCRPDREPEPGWVDAPELVCRALRLIADGALDDDTEDDLATRLGVSARHLRRLFAEHIGATPSEVARSRRAHFARRLLDDTDLPMTQIATAAGFQSVRHMNRVVKQVFPFTPQRAAGPPARPAPARRRRRPRAPAAVPAPARLGRAPRSSSRRARSRASSTSTSTPPCTAARSGWRWQDGDDRPRDRGRGRRGARRPALLLRAHLPDVDGLVHLVAQVRRLFDLDADPDADRHAPRARSAAAPARARQPGAARPGHGRPARDRGPRDPRPAGLGGRRRPDCRAALVAALRRGRSPASTPLGLTHLFPTAATLARRRPRRPRDHDDPGRRDPGVRRRATRRRSTARSSLDDLVARAPCALPGIGRWTAKYVAMRARGERDAFPAADLGLRHALGGSRPDALAAAAAWRPWRAYAAMHLWCAPGASHRAQTRQTRMICVCPGRALFSA